MAKKAVAQSNVVDLSDLSPKQRRKIDRALHPRDTMVSQRFAQADVESWKNAAMRNDEALQVWMERVLNAAAAAR